MIFIAFLVFALISLFGQFFGWQATSFDINDPEAARAKYAEIGAIEGLEEQGRAWCSLTDQELRAIAKHTEMSNTVTTTTHTSSTGETTTTTVVEPAPNQEALVESAVRFTADSCGITFGPLSKNCNPLRTRKSGRNCCATLERTRRQRLSGLWAWASHTQKQPKRSQAMTDHPPRPP